MIMPTDEERREYPHLGDEEWEAVEEARDLKARGEWPFGPRESGPPTFEERVLALLGEQSELLREIRDLLAAGGTPGPR